MMRSSLIAAVLLHIFTIGFTKNECDGASHCIRIINVLPLVPDPLIGLKDSLETITKGDVKVGIYGLEEGVEASTGIEMVRNGEADAVYGIPGSMEPDIPILKIFHNIPFGMDAFEFRAFHSEGRGKEMIDKYYQQTGIKAFYSYDLGSQMAGWSNFKYRKASQLSNKITRNGAFAPLVLEKLLGSVYENRNLPGSQYAESMENGVHEQLEFINPFYDKSDGIQIAQAASSLTKNQGQKWYYSFPSWSENQAALALLFNDAFYQDLPPYVQKLIEVTVDAELLRGLVKASNRNAEALEDITGELGIELNELPLSYLRKLKRTTQKVLREYVEDDEDAKEYLDEYLKYLKLINEWSKISYLKNGANREDLGLLEV